MAIQFDVKKCKDFLKHFPDGKLDGVPQWNGLFVALTYIMIQIGPPPRDEKDTKGFDEFWFRLDTYQHAIGALANRWPEGDDKPEPVYCTKEQAQALIGLSINIGPVSNAKFNAFMIRSLRTEHEHRNRTK